MNVKMPLSKEKKLTSEKLRIENKKMELRLQQLKLAISKEKEERLSNGNCSNWSTGTPGALLNYKPNISGIDSGKKIKLKMLKDEPVAPVIIRPNNYRPTNLKDIFEDGGLRKPKNDFNAELKGLIKNGSNRHCGQCEENPAAVNCKECAEDYCAKCFAAFHLKGALRKHRSTPISNLNNRVSIPSPLFKPPDLKNISNIISQDIKFNIHSAGRKGAQTNIFVEESSKETIENSKENELPKYTGASLAEGNYNEDLSNQYFQEAVNAWRNNVELTNSSKSDQKSEKIEHSTETIDSEQRSKLLSDAIQFTPSLTYAEQLLLRKHRNNQLATEDMKYILSRMAKTNDLDLLENQKLMQSNFILERSLINQSAEYALQNDSFHMDFGCINQLLNDVDLITTERLQPVPCNKVVTSVQIEELVPVQCELITNGDNLLKTEPSDSHIAKVNNEERNTNASILKLNSTSSEVDTTKSEVNNRRSKSVINRDNFYDRPPSSRRMSARTRKGGHITSKPSILLDVLAEFNKYLPSIENSPNESLQSSRRPASANGLRSSNKISYEFYKLAPNSWKPACALPNEMSNEIYDNITIKTISSETEEPLEEDMKQELAKLNFLAKESSDKNHLTSSVSVSSPKSSSSDELCNNAHNNVDVDYVDHDMENRDAIDQLQSLERELTLISRQDGDVSHRYYDDIIADSLDVTNGNECMNSMDSDKFCFEDSLDFQQKYCRDSVNGNEKEETDEEDKLNCDSRFDDYSDIHNLH